MKVDKALIIRREGVQISIDYAKCCADSCEEWNLPYEYIDAVQFLPCEEAFASVGMKKGPNYTNTMGNCGCHSSMIKCWKRIVELNEPCIILEHDAYILGDVRTIDIPDMSVVTFGGHVHEVDEYKPIGPVKKLTEIPRAKGCHAYSITPTTAKFLLDELEEKGVTVGVDRRLMMSPTMPLYMCDPPQAVAWNRLSTSNMTNESNGAKFNRIKNPPSMCIDSWNLGLKTT